MSLTAEFTNEHRSTSGLRPTGRDCAQWRERLALLLDRAGRGDQAAFAEFYDLTSGVVYGAMRRRYDAAAAASATHALYLRAWQDAPQQATSGLSPLAWLLAWPAVPMSTAC